MADISEKDQQVLDFMRSRPTATLATVSSASKPHAATIYAYVEDDFSVYFTVKSETNKYNNLVDSGLAALVISDDRAVQTVQLEGNAMPVEDPAKVAALRKELALIARLNVPASPPIDKMLEGEYVVFKVVPTWLRYADFKSAPADDKHFWYFHQVIPRENNEEK